ncbi:MAG TPA: hypothetical protein PLS53_01430 [Thermoanaerobaculaceae bacterium]|nr:hypothetical protein [Thermoanaerobaculaceae bacterium]HPS76798.1 hypothetical protein [Thermoanaerobaculaceae bacterium]
MVNVRWLVIALAALGLAGVSTAQEVETESLIPISSTKAQRVVIVNQPRAYTVQGKVSVDGPISQGSMVVLRDVLVPPVGPRETTRLVNAGSISTDGFTAMVVGVAGQIKDQTVRAGDVGAFLVPDDELVLRALDENGQLLFPVEVKASTGGGMPPYFASTQSRAAVGFPRYRVLLYNTSDKTATVTVFAYLSN